MILNLIPVELSLSSTPTLQATVLAVAIIHYLSESYRLCIGMNRMIDQ